MKSSIYKGLSKLLAATVIAAVSVSAQANEPNPQEIQQAFQKLVKDLKQVKDENGYKSSVEKFCKKGDSSFEVNLKNVSLSTVQVRDPQTVAPVGVTELFGFSIEGPSAANIAALIEARSSKKCDTGFDDEVDTCYKRAAKGISVREIARITAIFETQLAAAEKNYTLQMRRVAAEYDSRMQQQKLEFKNFFETLGRTKELASWMHKTCQSALKNLYDKQIKERDLQKAYDDAKAALDSVATN